MHKIYRGFIQHRRHKPVSHEMRYPIYYFYLHLQSLPDLLHKKQRILGNHWWLPRWRRSDYYQPTNQNIISLIQQKVENELGFKPQGAIYQLTQLRHFHYCFNPLTLYYCFDLKNNLQAVVADVGNTPWLERHTYVLDLRENMQPKHDKAFHVSPLLPMEMQYQWRFDPPEDKLHVHINNFKQGEKWFDASLKLTATPLTLENIKPILWRYPLQTYRIVLRIYWQALKLRLKGARYYQHPTK